MTDDDLDALEQRLRDGAARWAECDGEICNTSANVIHKLRQKLRRAEITLRGRQHSTKEQRDSPEVLRTLGFWPDCGCGECYAIHCLDEQMTRAALAEAERDAALRSLEAITEQIAAVRADAEGLMRSLASAWFYGNWKAETHNEREMQRILEKHQWWPITEKALVARGAAIDAAMKEPPA